MRFFVTAVLLAITAINAPAALIINYVESGPNVIMNGSGPLDLTGLSYGGSSTNSFGVFTNPTVPLIYQSASAGNVDAYLGSFTSTPFGSGSSAGASSHSGDGFLLVGNGLLWVPEGYLAAPFSLAFSQTYIGYSFASMGLTPGTFNTVLPSGDMISVVVGPLAPVIPEPSTYIAISGFVGLGIFLWRRRKAKLADVQTQ